MSAEPTAHAPTPLPPINPCLPASACCRSLLLRPLKCCCRADRCCCKAEGSAAVAAAAAAAASSRVATAIGWLQQGQHQQDVASQAVYIPKGVIRVWTWALSDVTMGHVQPLEKEDTPVDQDRTREKGVVRGLDGSAMGVQLFKRCSVTKIKRCKWLMSLIPIRVLVLLCFFCDPPVCFASTACHDDSIEGIALQSNLRTSSSSY